MPVLSRRRVLEPTSLGFGRVVLSHLLADVGLASPPASAQLCGPCLQRSQSTARPFPRPGESRNPAHPKRRPSQMDLFDAGP